ncbi:MAG: hypothetical protein ACRDI2_15810 [Chloroflexota bacterium]
MWDWYNRPGRRGIPRTRTVVLIMVVSGLMVGVVMTLLYTLIAPYLFTRVSG